MEKQDETNNIMEEKTLSVLSDSAGIEKVASESTSPARQLERMFSQLDENGDGKISPAELRQCLEALGGKLLEQELVTILDPYYGGGLLEHDDFVKLAESQENKEVQGNNYSKDAYFRDKKNTLPLSRNDLKNALLEQKALNRKQSLPFAVESMLDISPQQHGILLTSCGGLLSYLAKNSSTPFEFPFGKTTDTPVPSLLSFEDAVFAFFPEMAHIALFMIFYIMAWILVLLLRFGVQMLLMLLQVSAPVFYFPELVRKASASGVHVACGVSFKLPLTVFSTLGAFGITFVFGLVALLVFYLIWRFVYGRKPTRGKDIEVSSDDLKLYH